jgi:hypothetical protein
MREPVTPREAALRTAAVAALSGLAVAQLAALPYALLQGAQIAAICVAAIVSAARLGCALATAGAAGGRAAWRGTVALGAVVAGGWLVTRAVPVPGVAEDAGRWTSAVGLASLAAALALVALGAAGSGAPRGFRVLRAAAPAAGVGLALVPCAALALVALGPPPAHHHGVGPSSQGPHAFHVVRDPAAAARFRPGFGGHSGHYVYANATRPHLPPWALALALGAAAAAVSLARAALRARTLVAGPAPARRHRGGAC